MYDLNVGNSCGFPVSFLFYICCAAENGPQTLANALGSGGANGGFNPLYQIGGPRSVQLALKLQF
jgi:hypothetical protein